MQFINRKPKFLTVLISTLLLLAFVFMGNLQIVSPDPGLTINVQTNKNTYVLRNKVVFEGNVTLDGSPANNMVVAMQVDTPLATLAYDVLQIGTPTQTWVINITDISITNASIQEINTAKTDSIIGVSPTFYNPQLLDRAVYMTITVYDANMTPIWATASATTIPAQQSASPVFSVYIPRSACSGKAVIRANAFSKEPKTGGFVLAMQKTKYFCISRTQQGLFQYPTLPPPPPLTTPGQYKTNFTLTPDPKAGTYDVYVFGQVSPTVTAQSSTTFSVENSVGYPPQASFVFWPPAPYLNMTVNFDASSSTPEGFNDTIKTYKWNFGDSTSPTTESDPYITHNYQLTGNFIVTLNVTDNEGLWSTTSKPIRIYPEFGPKANFTWTPDSPFLNQATAFNASSSTTGWYARKRYYSPISTYKWNFSDGTGLFTRTTPTITHNWTQPGNYLVKLTVTDADGRSNTTSHIVTVQNVTIKMYDIDPQPNGNGRIDMGDIYIVAKAFGSYPGHPKWNPIADFNHDNRVDMEDLYPVCKNFGKDP